MNVPLNVIQDEDGRLRDVNGQPMIVVFPSKPQRPRAVPKSGTSKSEAKTADTQSFAFINVTRPDREDENSRQLIRTHVMKHFHARAREKQKLRSSNGIPRNSNKWKAATENETPVRNDPWHAPVLPAPAIGPEFVVFPVPMQPYMRRLIHQFATSIYPHLDPKPCSKPESSVWFPMVMTDPALFHAILCTSAIYIDLVSGTKQESFPQRKHMLEAISLINTRLQVEAKECVSDATITTILFIAKAEYAERNYVNWNIHMDGLTRIVKIRGGMTKLRNFIRQKIYKVSTELTGCIETGSIPRFLCIEDTVPAGPSAAARPLAPGIESLKRPYFLDQRLLSLLNEVEKLTNGVGTLSDLDLELTAVRVRYRLLSWNHSTSEDSQRSAINQSIRYGAILYIKTLVRSPSVRGIDYTNVLSRLRLHLSKLRTCPDAAGLVLWLLFFGGITSENICRSWFIPRLVDVATQAGVNTWENARLYLTSVWWVEAVHEEPCKRLWEDVKSMQEETSN